MIPKTKKPVEKPKTKPEDKKKKTETKTEKPTFGTYMDENGKIDWDKFKEFIPIREESLRIINRIENIHNYEGESATKYLKQIKMQAKNALYVLNNLLENQNES